MPIVLPVRFTGKPVDSTSETNLQLNPEKTAFLLVDVPGTLSGVIGKVIEENLGPAVQAARNIGMRIVYMYCYPGVGPDGPHSMFEEIHHTRRKEVFSKHVWQQGFKPDWPAVIEPRPEDALIAKCAQNSFQGTILDGYLRGWGVSTVLVTGFSFKSCVFYTMVGAFEHNYRAVLLRDGTDPPGTNEFPDTPDHTIPEKGWVRLVLTRLIEDHLGYTSTCQQFIDASNNCRRTTCGDKDETIR